MSRENTRLLIKNFNAFIPPPLLPVSLMVLCEQERPRLRSVPASVGTIGHREEQKHSGSQFSDADLLHLEPNVRSARWEGAADRCESSALLKPEVLRSHTGNFAAFISRGLTRNTIRKEGVSFAAPPVSSARALSVNMHG